MSLGRNGSHSQPRTPVSGIVPDFGSPRTPGAHTGRSLSLGSRSVGGSAGGGGGTSGLGAGTSSGKTVREYDESFRELKKENFNLKLRIYFLEERLGNSRAHKPDGASPATSTPNGKENLAHSNMDLKVSNNNKSSNSLCPISKRGREADKTNGVCDLHVYLILDQTQMTGGRLPPRYTLLLIVNGAEK